MRNVLYRMKNQFSDFYFSSYREKLIENWGDFEFKNDHNSKIKKWEKSDILFFFRFSTFRIFHVNLNTFEKKKSDFYDFFSRVMIICVMSSPQFSMNFLR